jgi:uncharacterized membrane protein
MERPYKDEPPISIVAIHQHPLCPATPRCSSDRVCLAALHAGGPNFNWDEAWSNWIVQLPYSQMIETAARDVHPPLYYQMLRVVQPLLGSSEFALRFPSVLPGLLSVALAYGLARFVGGRAVGLLAMLLMAVSRAHIDISQLARMHVLAAAFATGALWASVALWQGRSRRGAAIVYVCCTAGALYSFYLAAMLPLATNLAFALVWLRRGRPLRLLASWSALQIAAALLFLPWALYAIQLAHGWSSDSGMGFLSFLQYYAVILTMGLPAFWEDYLPLALAALAVVSGGVVMIARSLRRAPHQRICHLAAGGGADAALVVFL